MLNSERMHHIGENLEQPPPTKQCRHTADRPNCFRQIEFFVGILNRMLIGFVTVYMCWLCLRQPIANIPWHACLCTIGFTFLMAEGLMCHYRGNAWTHFYYRPEKTTSHWIIQLIGSAIGIGGIIVRMCIDEVHFQTVHGKVGLAALILCLASLTSGLCSLFSVEIKNCLQPILNKTIHNAIGLGTFTLAMVSMCYGFDTEIFMQLSMDAGFNDFVILLKMVTVCIFVLSAYGPLWCIVYSKIWSFVRTFLV